MKKAVVSFGLLLAAGFLIGFVAQSVMADGEVDYCYVSHANSYWGQALVELHGHRAWRLDRKLAVYGSIGDALSGAELLHCPVEHARRR